MDVVNINQFWCCCACASLEPALRSFCFRSLIKKNGDHYVFSFELCSPLDPTNPFYLRHLIYIYIIYVREKLGLGRNDVHQTVDKYLSVTGSKMTLKHIPVVLMRNNNNPKLVYIVYINFASVNRKQLAARYIGKA